MSDQIVLIWILTKVVKLRSLFSKYWGPLNRPRSKMVLQQWCTNRIIHFISYITAMSPTEVFAGTPYFDVFWLAISTRISWYALSNPYVRMMTELLSSMFRSLMILNKSFLESEGSPSVRNKITRFLLFPEFSETEPFSSSNAFSNAGMNFVWPIKQKKN